MSCSPSPRWGGVRFASGREHCWFMAYMAKDTAEKDVIFNSGLVANNPEIVNNLTGGGRLFQAPYWGDSV